MVSGLLKRLSEKQVPPPPVTFESELNTRLNDRLLISQVLDFVCRAMPYTFMEFGKALIGLVVLTLTGRSPGDRRRRR